MSRRGRPSALTLAIGILAVVGLGISAYLTYLHYAGLQPLCVASHGCEKVQSSHWSKLGGIPVATLGLVGYALIIGCLFVPGEAGLAGCALFALVGFGFRRGFIPFTNRKTAA